ncbi:MAG: Smr/MutS family protein [Gallionella sp.]|nr:Smr/MutS family protein [Gallionella sp.]
MKAIRLNGKAARSPVATQQEKVSPREPRVDGDAALFRATVGTVTPLTEQNHINPSRPVTHARVRSPAQSHVLPDTLSDHASGNAPEDYLGNGLSHLTLRKLRRSTAQDTLDLHGNPIDAARMLLQQFLFEAVQNDLRHVLVIHGKGTNSPGGEAVLRTLTRNWLMQHPQVLAYCAASPGLGGSGAVLILLKVASS